jgi:hypothetical protein
MFEIMRGASVNLQGPRVFRGLVLQVVLCSVFLFLPPGPAHCGDGTGGTASYDPYFSLACGPVNLYLALRLLGKSPTLEEVCVSCSSGDLGRADFAGIKRTAEKYGLSVVCAKLNVPALKALNDLAILHLTVPEGGHFVLSKGWRNNRFDILDATRPVKGSLEYHLSSAELARIWDGNAMVLSSGPIVLPHSGGGHGFLILGVLVAAIAVSLWVGRAKCHAWRRAGGNG